MSDFEFIEYIQTPNERHLGIATVLLYGKVFHKYKILPTKDGNGFFPVPASYKVGDKYIHAFGLVPKKDGSDNGTDELIAIIKAGVKNFMAKASNSNGNRPPIAQNKQGNTNTHMNGYPSSNSNYNNPPPF
jgi:hypothetical protein